MLRAPLLSLSFVLTQIAFCQVSGGPLLNCDFNRDKPSEQADSRYNMNSCLFIDDRFGNEQSALYFQGQPNSYLTLGPSAILKSGSGTISLWFNMHGIMGTGKGVESNPIFSTRSHAGEDCNDALYLGVDMNTRYLNGASLNSPMDAVSIYSRRPIRMANWHHAALTYDDKHLALYLDGELQYKAAKNFRTGFLAGDSIMIGNRFSEKNRRYFLGGIDDIKIYDRVLSEAEIGQLYEAPNQNRVQVILIWTLKALALLAGIGMMAWLIRHRVRQIVQREKEKHSLQNRWYEQEMRVLKAQMDPHFIFNSLNTIQQFIMVNENEKAQLYLSKFSRLIRKLLDNNGNDTICLEEEIDILNSYIEIEALRFNNVFNYSINVDPNLKDRNLSIPHFMIQPVVENAIWHGLLPKDGDKTLEVSFSLVSESMLSCVVEDNGIGRDSTGTRNNGQKKSSLALGFIRHRLELMRKILDNNYQVEIIDKKQGNETSLGTKVIITMPVFNSN